MIDIIKNKVRQYAAANALAQAGPWNGEDIDIDTIWLKRTLADAIARIDWNDASADVERFLRPPELQSVQLWSERFFLAKLEKLIPTSLESVAA